MLINKAAVDVAVRSTPAPHGAPPGATTSALADAAFVTLLPLMERLGADDPEFGKECVRRDFALREGYARERAARRRDRRNVDVLRIGAFVGVSAMELQFAAEFLTRGTPPHEVALVLCAATLPALFVLGTDVGCAAVRVVAQFTSAAASRILERTKRVLESAKKKDA